MKLALGTVQFGLDYGISNQLGQVSVNGIQEILKIARTLGINTLDCAGAYGNSEKILGELSVSENFNLISKVPALTHEIDSIVPFFENCLTNLQCKNIDTLLFHQVNDLLNSPNKLKLYEQISLLKKNKKIKKIGVSVYSPEQLISVTDSYDIDIIQAPVNIFDQRFISKPVLAQCINKGVKIHARSLFLQGLLFINEDKLQPYFSPYKDKLKAFNQLAKALSCSKLTLALSLLAQDSLNTKGHVTANTVIEKIVVGVCNAKQLLEIFEAYQQAQSLNISSDELALLADTRLGFINPSLWKT